jgi:hypothetical protein
LAGALLASLLLAGWLLPGLDVGDGPRLLLYGGMLAVFLGRWLVAILRREHGRGWLFYLALILLAPAITLRVIDWALSRP